MFDIDSGKLLIVAVLALIVIGPKELPRVLRQVGQAVGKMRRMANDFQGQFMDAMKEADIADIRKELDELKAATAVDYFNPARDIQAEITSTVSSAFTTTSSDDKPVSAAAEIQSPAAGFELPSGVDAVVVEAGATPAAEGIGPELPPSADAFEPAPNLITPVPKRRILVKRRRSTFNVVRNAETAWSSGQPLDVRQRSVKSKALVESDVTPA